MIIPIAIAGSIGLLYVAGVLMWPTVIKPSLRRRYERRHHRNKIARDNRNYNASHNDSGS